MKKIIFALICFNLLVSTAWSKPLIAVVKTAYAIVYADTLMKAPIGKVTHGRALRVGGRPLNRGQVVPTVINGRLAYVPIKYLSFTSREEPVENGQLNNVEFEHKKFQFHQSSNLSNQTLIISLNARYEIIDGGDLNSLRTKLGDDAKSNITSYSAQVEWWPVRYNYSFGGGLKKLQYQSTSLDLAAMVANFFFSFHIYKNSFMRLAANVSPFVATSFSLTTKTSSQDLEYVGNFYGATLGPRIKFFPTSLLNINLGAQYHWSQTALEELEISGSENVVFNSISGISYYGGLGFSF